MKLTGVDCQIPSRKISNEDIVELIKFYSVNDCSNLNELMTLVRKFLPLTGIESRCWRNENEKPIDLVIESVDNALKMAGLERQHIDLVIYSSIDRGFIEPANSSFICKALGMKNVRNFDVTDACMGWASAVQIAHSFLISSQSINHILIINAEFPMDEKGCVFPNNFIISDKKELRYKSASFTLGEAASACIFSKEVDTNCKFEFIEDAENAGLCTIPLPNSKKYLVDSSGYGFHEDFNFRAYSSSLLQHGRNTAVKVLQTLMNNLAYTPKIIFPHSVSYKIIKEESVNAGVSSLVYSTFSILGNLATASIPSAIKAAILDHSFKKNEKGIAWIGSAGMKYAAFEIQF